MSTLLIQLAHFFISSLLVFTGTILLLELGLFLFRVKNPRLRSLYRLLPILKLPLDLILYKFSGWNLFTNFNPLSCQYSFEKMILNWFHIEAEGTTPLATVLSQSLPAGLLSTSVILIVSLSILLLLKRLFACFSGFKQLGIIRQTAEPTTRKITNPQLLEKVTASQTTILVSNLISMPFALHSDTIVIPRRIETLLSQEEFETVISHEFAHLRWKDPLFKMVTLFITSLFWWVPIKWWLNRLYDDQEKACDAEVSRYGLDQHALASAIVKIVQEPQLEKRGLCHLAAKKSALMKRLQVLLSQRPTGSPLSSLFGAIVSTSILMVFWIC
ncbi:MAG: hypothetical protein S4CHLAM2_01230 [Chlamydiales bacterium]|nr:hypothetical protein [Chlamydiales bacterium]